MNPDECRKAFKAWCKEHAPGPQPTLLWNIWQAAWNARTESKPVTREWALKVLSDQLIPFEARVDKVLDALQLSAPQSPRVIKEWVTVPVPEFDREWVKTKNPLEEIKTQLEIIRNHPASFYVSECAAYALAFLVELQVPQSTRPTYPYDEMLRTMREWASIASESRVMTKDDLKLTLQNIALELLKLLTRKSHSDRVPLSACPTCGAKVGDTGFCVHRSIHCKPRKAPQSPVVPGVDIGWVRSVLLNMKPSEIDDVARLIFDTLATGGRESREDRYREALRMAEKCLAESMVRSTDQRNRNYIALDVIRSVLATTRPNGGDGSGNG